MVMHSFRPGQHLILAFVPSFKTNSGVFGYSGPKLSERRGFAIPQLAGGRKCYELLAMKLIIN
jgi:hypothetical protein